MKTYRVGGAVRDRLLGRPSTDQDWVVVGSTPMEMAAAGFIPVGRDFPVFLHPQTKEEYALARTERKTAPGYRGFAFHADPSVTLEEDLARRDLTINAMALDSDGSLIDPYGGQRDLQARVLRHVSPAFVEDPVRILRLARLGARFDDFSVAPETLALAREMVEAGEIDALVPERVWQELARGLLEARPSRMLVLLDACGALARLLPELEWALRSADRTGESGIPDAGARLMRTLDLSATLGADLPVRFACLAQGLHGGSATAQRELSPVRRSSRALAALEDLCRRLRVPVECCALAEIVARESANVHQCEALGAEALLDLLVRCDALRRPQRFADLLLACECEARASVEAGPYRPRAYLWSALQAALAVDTAVVAAQARDHGAVGPAIGSAISTARSRALAQHLARSEGARSADDGPATLP